MLAATVRQRPSAGWWILPLRFLMPYVAPLAAPAGSETLKVLSGEPEWSIGLGTIGGLTISPDGKWLALSTTTSRFRAPASSRARRSSVSRPFGPPHRIPRPAARD
jgi:hypothetical protein